MLGCLRGGKVSPSANVGGGAAAARAAAAAAAAARGPVVKAIDRPLEPDKLTLLARACRERLPEVVQLLLAKGASVSVACGPDRRLPLHWALLAPAPALPTPSGGGGEVAAVVAQLIRAGADVEAADAVGMRPLHVACRHGHAAAAKQLLEAGADKDARDRICAPIHYACGYGHEACALLLIRRGANLLATSAEGLSALGALRQGGHEGRMPLAAAKLSSHAQSAMKVASGKRDAAANYLPLNDPVNAKDVQGNTQLANAVREANLGATRRLLMAGADPSVSDFSGWAPLHIAARFKLVAIGLLLLECGAPYRATSDGMLPLDLYKVDLDEDDEEENLPLFLELSKAATSYFSLVARGKLPPPPPKLQPVAAAVAADPSTSPAKAAKASAAPAAGSAAAAAAAASAAAAAAIDEEEREKAEKEAELKSLDERDNVGRTKLLRAVREGRAEEAERLLRLGADPDRADAEGWTPLHHACALGLEAFVPLLLGRATREELALGKDKRRGADAGARLPAHEGADRAGFTAAHLAVESGRSSTRLVLRRLKEGGADVDALDAEGSSPLLLAVIKNRTSALKALLALGADANAADAGGVSALFHALQWMRDGAAACLVERGAALSDEVRRTLAQQPPDLMQRTLAAVAARDGVAPPTRPAPPQSPPERRE